MDKLRACCDCGQSAYLAVFVGLTPLPTPDNMGIPGCLATPAMLSLMSSPCGSM
jgi:hypothetical protein